VRGSTGVSYAQAEDDSGADHSIVSMPLNGMSAQRRVRKPIMPTFVAQKQNHRAVLRHRPAMRATQSTALRTVRKARGNSRGGLAYAEKLEAWAPSIIKDRLFEPRSRKGALTQSPLSAMSRAIHANAAHQGQRNRSRRRLLK